MLGLLQDDQIERSKAAAELSLRCSYLAGNQLRTASTEQQPQRTGQAKDGENWI